MAAMKPAAAPAASSEVPPLPVLSARWPDYALLDTGHRRKLERFGAHVIIRSEPKAWWEPALDQAAWAQAAAVHEDEGPWRLTRGTPREWTMRWRELTLQARLTDGSKHLGLFPEQAPHWEFIHTHACAAGATPLRMLNLFGYTGAASLVAAAAGCAVTHVDASKPAVSWARHNQTLSGLERAPVRWILDDAVKFLRREIRREVRYDAISLDPPSFGRGPAGEVWKVEAMLPELLSLCRQALSKNPRFILLTMYNLEASALMLGNLLEEMMRGQGGRVTRGELALTAEASSRPLPLSLWARWESGV